MLDGNSCILEEGSELIFYEAFMKVAKYPAAAAYFQAAACGIELRI